MLIKESYPDIVLANFNDIILLIYYIFLVIVYLQWERPSFIIYYFLRLNKYIVSLYIRSFIF